MNYPLTFSWELNLKYVKLFQNAKFVDNQSIASRDLPVWFRQSDGTGSEDSNYAIQDFCPKYMLGI